MNTDFTTFDSMPPYQVMAAMTGLAIVAGSALFCINQCTKHTTPRLPLNVLGARVMQGNDRVSDRLDDIDESSVGQQGEQIKEKSASQPMVMSSDASSHQNTDTSLYSDSLYELANDPSEDSEEVDEPFDELDTIGENDPEPYDPKILFNALKNDMENLRYAALNKLTMVRSGADELISLRTKIINTTTQLRATIETGIDELDQFMQSEEYQAYPVQVRNVVQMFSDNYNAVRDQLEALETETQELMPFDNRQTLLFDLRREGLESLGNDSRIENGRKPKEFLERSISGQSTFNSLDGLNEQQITDKCQRLKAKYADYKKICNTALETIKDIKTKCGNQNRQLQSLDRSQKDVSLDLRRTQRQVAAGIILMGQNETPKPVADFDANRPATWTIAPAICLNGMDRIAFGENSQIKENIDKAVQNGNGKNKGRYITTNENLHAHLSGGSGGVAFRYQTCRLAGELVVVPVIYDIAGSRGANSKNTYAWSKGTSGTYDSDAFRLAEFDQLMKDKYGSQYRPA